MLFLSLSISLSHTHTDNEQPPNNTPLDDTPPGLEVRRQPPTECQLSTDVRGKPICVFVSKRERNGAENGRAKMGSILFSDCSQGLFINCSEGNRSLVWHWTSKAHT